MTFVVRNLNIISSDYGTNEDDFWITLAVDISEIGGFGSEVFNVNVVGIGRLSKIIENEDILGKGIIISKSYNQKSVTHIFTNLIKNINTWAELSQELSKYFSHQ